MPIIEKIMEEILHILNLSQMQTLIGNTALEYRLDLLNILIIMGNHAG